MTAKAFFPGQAPIDAYGNGGFRFAHMSHRGSLFCLPSGIHGWDVTAAATLKLADFSLIIDEQDDCEILLLGTGEEQIFPDLELRKALEAHSFSVEAMDTGAACRTYNILLNEKRRVAAALMAVP